jgi:hypothetical protein
MLSSAIPTCKKGREDTKPSTVQYILYTAYSRNSVASADWGGGGGEYGQADKKEGEYETDKKH